MITVLLVDDQRALRRSLALLLDANGFRTEQAASGEEALAKARTQTFDVIVTDMRMEGLSGIDLLRELRARGHTAPVVVITAYGSIESAVEAMRLGAFDYITKPFDEAEMVEKIRAAHALHRSTSPRAPHSAGNGAGADDIVARSPAMRALLIKAERLAQTDLSVLIVGETGTGKSRLARMLHELSPRRTHAFVAVNCASLPEPLLESELFGHVKGSFTGATETRAGLFEEADGGTIFLDEIDTLSPLMQAKLLGVLQDREIRRVGANKTKTVDIRVISASNQDMQSLLNTDKFRQDLYYRINGVRLHIPPLRERREDIEPLLERLLAVHAKKHRVSPLRIAPAARARVLAYDYPGNVRQLESVVEQMVAFAAPDGSIDLPDLPEDLIVESRATAVSERVVVAEGSALADSERAAIEAALARHESLSDAARELGIGRTTLWRKMRHYQLQRIPSLARRR